MRTMFLSLLLPAVACGHTPTVGCGWNVLAHDRGHLWSLSPEGQLRWRFDAVNLLSHIGAKNVVYALMAYDEKYREVLAAVDRETGEVRWRFEPVPPYGPGGILKEAPLADDGTIYVTMPGTQMGECITPSSVHAVSADGRLKWIWDAGICDSRAPEPPVLGMDGTVFVTRRGRGQGSLHALRPDSGTRKWSIQDPSMDGIYDSRMAVGRDGTVYVTPRRPHGATSLLIITGDGNVHVNKTLELCGDDNPNPLNRPDHALYVGFYGDVIYIDGVRCGGGVTFCGVCAFDGEGELLWARDQYLLISHRIEQDLSILLTRKVAESSHSDMIAAITGRGSMLWEANISKDMTLCHSHFHIDVFCGHREREGQVLVLQEGNELWHADLHRGGMKGDIKGVAVTPHHNVVYAQFEHHETEWYFQMAAIGSNGSQVWDFTAEVANLAMVV